MIILINYCYVGTAGVGDAWNIPQFINRFPTLDVETSATEIRIFPNRDFVSRSLYELICANEVYASVANYYKYKRKLLSLCIASLMHQKIDFILTEIGDYRNKLSPLLL